MPSVPRSLPGSRPSTVTISATCIPNARRNNMREADIQRFWSKVDRSGPCWRWTGGVFRCANGNYGRFWLGTKATGRDHHAHRIAYMLTHGRIPAGMEVCHHCDNPSCVRPDHLFLGTHSDNMRDMLAKGRRRNLPGDTNGNSKLTWSDVRAIRTRYAAGGISLKALATHYHVNTALVHRIVRGQIWKEQ